MITISIQNAICIAIISMGLGMVISNVGSKVLRKEPVLDKIKEEIKDNTYFINETTEKEGIDFETVEKIIDKYKAESEVNDADSN